MKLVLVVVLLFGAGAAAYFLMQGPMSPEHRTCAKFVDLCGSATMSVDKCVDVVRDLKKSAGQSTIDTLATCTTSATSCPGALGCLTGAGMKTATGAVGDFLKGLGDSLKQ